MSTEDDRPTAKALVGWALTVVFLGFMCVCSVRGAFIADDDSKVFARESVVTTGTVVEVIRRLSCDGYSARC